VGERGSGAVAPMVVAGPALAGGLGGMLGGWLAGLLDEHEGRAEHDNAVLVSLLALLAGGLGGGLGGAIGGAAAAADPAVAYAGLAGSALFAAGTWYKMVGDRYRLVGGFRPVTRGSNAATGPIDAPAPARAARSQSLPPAVAAEGRLATPSPDGRSRTAGSVTFRVHGMNGPDGADEISRRIKGMPGVTRVDVDVHGKEVWVAYTNGFEGADAVAECIDSLGYLVLPAPS
jgi:copper chaperone CopZ